MRARILDDLKDCHPLRHLPQTQVARRVIIRRILSIFLPESGQLRSIGGVEGIQPLLEDLKGWTVVRMRCRQGNRKQENEYNGDAFNHDAGIDESTLIRKVDIGNVYYSMCEYQRNRPEPFARI